MGAARTAPVEQRYPVRRQATSLEGSEEDVRQLQKVRHVGVKGLSDYARRHCGALFPSKLDVAGSSSVSRCPRSRDVFGASTKRR